MAIIKTIAIFIAVAAIFFAGFLTAKFQNPAKIAGSLRPNPPERQTIGAREVIDIESPSGSKKVVAKIDTGADSSSIDMRLAKSLGYDVTTAKKKMVVTSEGSDLRDVIDFTFVLGAKTITTEATVESRGNLSTKILIGRKDLNDFVISPSDEFLTGPESSADID